MIQLEQKQQEEFVVGWGGWLTPSTYIQLAGAGSKKNTDNHKIIFFFDFSQINELENCKTIIKFSYIK